MLSQDILLGDMLKRQYACVYLTRIGDGEVCGCALGGALLANGFVCTGANQVSKDGVAMTTICALTQLYPWLDKDTRVDIGIMYGAVARREQTFEQLVDYVKSIEPVEEKVQQLDTEDVAVLV